MSNIFWVGVRQSDIEDTDKLFKGSITIFGDNTNGNIAFCNKSRRINHNTDNPECTLFFENTLNELCKSDPSVQFMFYNPEFAFNFNKLILQHTICLNKYNIIKQFSNKQRSRFIVSDIVDTIPFIILPGRECIYNNLLEYFVGFNEFIIQKVESSGGEGTFHIDSSSEINNIVLDGEKYLVSPFIENAISLNIHIVIFEKEIVCFPPSIQIITEIDNRLLYSGADYICCEMMTESMKQLIIDTSRKLGEFVQQKGYRGILGIDYLIKDNQLFFVEFNARFQGSSQLLNKALIENGQMTLQEINVLAFTKTKACNISPISVNYSNYVYTSSNISSYRLNQIIKSKEAFHIQKDGYSSNNEPIVEKNIYLNRIVFNRNICSINNNSIIIHPNIFVEDIKALLNPSDQNYKAYIKIALLNHGVFLSDSALKLARNKGRIKDAVFDAIDIIIFDSINVNVPCSCKFDTFSPFTIEDKDDKFVLFLDKKRICEVKIFFEPEVLLDKYTSSGVPYNCIINLATDRIRINPAPVCWYKKQGVSCKFCNLPINNILYSINDIIEVIDYCLDNVDFRHFLIGGGTYSLDDNAWSIIMEIAKHIRTKSNKEIYLMSIPPMNEQVLYKLKSAGITEVAFNIEIFDRTKARQYMPGKGKINFNQYEKALKTAVSIWGATGNVRSLLILGFDLYDVFLEGIEKLCKLGVEPIISVFRPLKNTALEMLNPPPTSELIMLYERCKKITERYSLILGPDCPQCQNNTLSFTELPT